MIDFITKSISRTISFWMLVLMTLSSMAVMYSTISKINTDNIEETKHNLAMLNVSIFQTLRNAMNTGDPATIEQAEKDAATMKGIEKLVVVKSKKLIDLYSPGTPFTKDTDVIKAFDTKKNIILEIDKQDKHSLRMIKPMIATKDCLMCHSNQNEGDVIGVMDLTFSLKHSDEKKMEILTNIVITSTILGWITIGIIYYIVTTTTKPIEGLKEGFGKLLDSENLEDGFKLDLKTKGEIADVIDLFNRYMKKVTNGLKQDEIVIQETNDILQKVSSGFLNYEVKSTANNQHVEELKTNLNDMLKSLRTTIHKINVTLKHYSKSDYEYQLDDKGVYGELAVLTNSIKLVGNNSSELLAVVLNTGEKLHNNTQILSEASQKLANSVEEQATTGRNTTEALDSITRIIQENSDKTIKMSEIAKNVTKSANHGKQLATSTSSAMDDIVEQVQSINEAIKMIDQIAFQTNILSLNAAVEAATAGEAGKGFAVVAQEVRNLASRSAEAAKDIKDIVESATQKANTGKEIADDMIDGYNNLNADISNTIDIIDEVSSSSKEQEQAILKINTAVVRMSRSTRNNAGVSKNISNMSKDIDDMSDSLVTTALHAKFLQEIKNQVCDVELMYSVADLKVSILDYTSNVFEHLATYSSSDIKKCITLDKWLEKYSEDKKLDKTVLEELSSLNQKLYNVLRELVDISSTKKSNNMLNEKADEVERITNNLFNTLNEIKLKKCS